MIEFTVPAKEFKKGIRMMLVGRNEFLDKDTADFSASADELQLCSTGTSTVIPAAVSRAGYARVPLAVLKSVKRAAASFRPSRLRVRIEAGHFRIESFGFSNPDIELMPLGRRIADVPIDVCALDTLALLKLCSAEEIADSGLAARVVEAQERAIRAIEWAANSLKEFRVPREAVRDLLEAHVALHAKTMKAAMDK
jgi:hypothetical protein